MAPQDMLPDDPNDAPKAPGDPDSHADGLVFNKRLNADGTCSYLGGTYQPAETICHKGGRWVCEAGEWRELNEPC